MGIFADLECWPKMDRLKTEAAFRVSLAALAGYILAIASIPQIIPPSQRVTVAIMASVLPLVLPKLIFVIAGGVPTAIGMVTLAACGGTALLAASTVSNAVYTIVFTVYSLYCMTLYYGNKFEKTTSCANMMVAIGALIALSLHPLVQNGFSISSHLDSKLPESMKAKLWAHLCRAMEPDEPNCVARNVNSFSWRSGPLELPHDLDDAFAGQTAYLTVFADGEVTLDIPGGIWLVKAMWTERGLENSLAVFSNLYVALCWVVACHIVFAVFFPFGRSVRRLITQVVVPASIQRVRSLLLEEEKGEDEGATTRGIIHLWTTYSRKISAMVIMFEPRLIRAPLEYIVPDLQTLLDDVQGLLVAALNYTTYSSSESKTDDQIQILNSCLGLLETSAKVLQTSRYEDVMLLKSTLEALPVHPKAAITHDAYLEKYCQKVAQASLDWIIASDDRSKERTPMKDVPQHLSKMYLPWIIAPLMPLIRLCTAWVVIPTHPKRWNIRSVLYACKMTAGYVTLFCMTLYWPAFANFRIEVSGDAALGGLYHGWHLLGYAYASTPSVEGTVKKGFSRVFGTFVGSFLAWLGIIVCSWSYDDDADINPYGLVVWITAFTVLSSLWYLDSGYGAFMGMNADNGASGMYLIMTLVLVAIEVYMGSGTKADIVLNRSVATLTGVLMAVVIAVIPPQVGGGDPVHARRYYTSLKEAVEELVRLLANDKSLPEGDKLASFRKHHLKKIALLGRTAFMLHDDAARLHRFPVCRVDKRLLPVLESLALIESLVIQTANAILSDVKEGEETNPMGSTQTDIEGVDMEVYSALLAKGLALLEKEEQQIVLVEESRKVLSPLLTNERENGPLAEEGEVSTRALEPDAVVVPEQPTKQDGGIVPDAEV